MITAVCDANVFISALITPAGRAATLLRRASDGDFELHVSAEIIEEVVRALAYPHVHAKVRRTLSEDDVRAFIDGIAGGYQDLGIVPPLDIEMEDSEDMHLVAAAYESKADYLVSTDKEAVLPMNDRHAIRTMGLKVVSIPEFMQVLDAG